LKGDTLSKQTVPTLALIHTSPTLAPVFAAICRREIPEAQIFHMVDESLIQDTVRAGNLRKLTIRRLVSQIESAEAAGADAVLVTCSSIGPGVTLAQQLFDIPVLRIDDAMAEAAVQRARTIGVLATLRTTLNPTTALLREKAAEAGRAVELVECLCEGAFPAVLAGDTETHDRILRHALTEDLKGVDVIVLAQASMARVVATLAPGTLQAPVLSSPELAVQRARQALALPEVARASA
jgi:Asp/Glu/hydantoin racemase